MTNISFLNLARHCCPRLLTWPAVVCRRSAVAAVASGPRAVGVCAPPEFSAAPAWPGTRNICKNALKPDIFMLKTGWTHFQVGLLGRLLVNELLGGGGGLHSPHLENDNS